MLGCLAHLVALLAHAHLLAEDTVDDPMKTQLRNRNPHRQLICSACDVRDEFECAVRLATSLCVR